MSSCREVFLTNLVVVDENCLEFLILCCFGVLRFFVSFLSCFVWFVGASMQ